MADWLERRMTAEAPSVPVETMLPEPTALEAALAVVRPHEVPVAVRTPAEQRRNAIEDVLASKILRAHLANRLQTSFPLTLNLDRREADETSILLSVLAAALCAGAAKPRPLSKEFGRLAGAGERTLSALPSLLRTTLPIGDLVAEVEERRLQPDALAVSMAALTRPNAAEQAYLAYLAARLGLSAEIVRGITQRYRR